MVETAIGVEAETRENEIGWEIGFWSADYSDKWISKAAWVGKIKKAERYGNSF